MRESQSEGGEREIEIKNDHKINNLWEMFRDTSFPNLSILKPYATILYQNIPVTLALYRTSVDIAILWSITENRSHCGVYNGVLLARQC